MEKKKFSKLPEVEKAWNYPLFEALFNRRSRRFGLGMEIPEGPNKFKSLNDPIPLSEIEEALLVAAGTGVSGLCLSDLPWPAGDSCPDRSTWSGGGNTIIQYTGRTWPSACASHGTELLFTNDSGVYIVKLKDIKADKLREIEGLSDRERILAVFRQNTIKLKDGRLDVPRSIPAIFSFNLWNANAPGSTLFMPVSDVTWEYINALMTFVEHGFYLVDDLNGLKPCGNEKWVKKGLLREDLIVPMSVNERMLSTAICGEGAFIGQNIMLAMQAMGLGGWIYGGFTPLIIMGGTPLCKGLGFRFVTGKTELAMPSPVGIDGAFEAFCPPYFKSMDAAVDAVVEAKWGKEGIFTPEGGAAPYKEKAMMDRGIPRVSDDVIQCTKDICNYVYDTYGRFPATVDAMNMYFWIQAQHIETEFYDKYYKEGAYTETQRDHLELWHASMLAGVREED